MYIKTKHEGKIHFCINSLQCFICEIMLTNHKRSCLEINGKQCVNMLRKGYQDTVLRNFVENNYS